MSSSIAIIGYGRFGAALAELLVLHKHRVLAFDTHSTIPASYQAPSLKEVLKRSEVVMICVPVGNMQHSLQELRPYLRNDQIVIDVGSVKTGPSALMQEILGTEIPWIATHPLFGPTSIALGERPRGVIVCPNLQHPQIHIHAKSLYESIECEVRIQSAEEHDLEMAQSHALAYFVAKGFLDSGVTLNTPNAPPSAQAIYRTVEAVQEDAAHLFATLHRENPYAKDARRRLLDALNEVDQVLNEPIPKGEQAHREKGLLHIDAPLEIPPQLQEARNIIDDIDSRIMRLLAQRAAVSLRASKAKEKVGHEVRDPRREKTLLDQRALFAEELALEPDAVGEIFDAILRFSRKHQARDRAQSSTLEDN